MDQLPHSNDGYNSLFADSQQFHSYDNAFLNGTDHNFNDAGWSLNSGNNFPNQSRGQPTVPSWQHNANHLSASSANNNFNGPPSHLPYGRSLSHSPAPFQQNQYGSFGNPQQQYRQPAFDPALFTPTTSGQDFNSNYATYGSQPQSLGTIAPQALQQETRSPALPGNNYANVNYAQNAFAQSRFAKAPAPTNVDQQALVAGIPRGSDAGFHSIINFDQMVRATNSERMGDYLTIGKQSHEWPVNRTSTLPQYMPRRSKNDLRKLADNDATLLAKIGKKSMKKERSLAPVQTAAQFLGVKGPGSPQIKYEGESSSSEESSDDDDDSSYTSEEEEELEGSPLPKKRPEGMKEAVEYDTVKALWRPKRKTVTGDEIKRGLGDFWDIVKTIRDRWKTDAAAVMQAEEKKRIGELPLLNSRVKDQRDMMEAAFKAAFKQGHRSIVELMAENPALIFVCYQFLLDRHKAEDMNGSLSRAILELMVLFTTLNETTVEKTHLVKVLPRYVKMGDAKTQGYAKRITANAAAASKEKAAVPQPAKPATTSKPAVSASPPARRADPEPIAGIKRSASNAGDGGAQKKVATGSAKPNGVSSAAKLNGVIKKPTTTGQSAKAPATTMVPATKTKQVTAKPSSFFSTLQSAKKPGTSIKAGLPAQAAGTRVAEKKSTPSTATASAATLTSTFSFAATMANLAKPKAEKPAAKPEKELPPETPEQKAKRLRKEARRKLHVSFKLGEDLEEVRYFTHDPEEELGHDDSQMRDMADTGGEGRALKKHQDLMELDEDEDNDGEDVEQELIDFRQPTPVDFSHINVEDRERNYVKYGGELEPESPERAAREQYEANTLIVFYTDENDIPPNPREPSDPYNGEPVTQVKQFGAPEGNYAIRAKQKKASRPRPYHTQQPPAQAQPAFDLSKWTTNYQQQQQPQMGQPPAQHPPTGQNIDITSILANLQSIVPQAQQQQPQAPSMMNFGAQLQQPPHSAPQPNGQVDLSAILAAMGQQGAAQQAPQMGGYGGAAGAPPMTGFMPQMQQQAGGGIDRWRDQGEKNKFFKTKVCRYWQEGRCMKGDGCTYLHEEPGA